MLDHQIHELSTFDFNIISDHDLQFFPTTDSPATTSTHADVFLRNKKQLMQATLNSKRPKSSHKNQAVRDRAFAAKLSHKEASTLTKYIAISSRSNKVLTAF